MACRELSGGRGNEKVHSFPTLLLRNKALSMDDGYPTGAYYRLAPRTGSSTRRVVEDLESLWQVRGCGGGVWWETLDFRHRLRTGGPPGNAKENKSGMGETGRLGVLLGATRSVCFNFILAPRADGLTTSFGIRPFDSWVFYRSFDDLIRK